MNADAPGTVLVAEDHEGVRELVSMFLGRRGWTILEAADGHEAMHLIDRDYQAIDLLVLDIVMPRVSGIEVAVRALARRPGIPVVLMSATPRGDLPPGAIGRDVIFLQKPFTIQQLTAAIDVALSRAGVPLAEPATTTEQGIPHRPAR